MTGTRAMSGSDAIRFRKRTMAACAVQHGLVHVDVDDLRAVLHLLAGHGQRFVELPVQDHPGECLANRSRWCAHRR